MKKKKRQRIKEGAIVRIELSEDRLAFGRLFPGGRIGVYDYTSTIEKEYLSIEELIGFPIFLYCVVYDDVITRGMFDIIGFKELTQTEIDKMPPMFMQDIMNIDDCVIFDYNGNEKKVTPQECIGLERASVWEAHGLVKRIEDYYAGKKNFNVELNKPILSKEDPRYMAGPNLKWSFEEEKFYKT
ncbi:MAG: immunity 26/phosphotriesterase HocA family protein [Chitinophagaceae bacterium]|nr:immunity 26/phosphotriesterase HocA family protein [Chitinophagaceae bacterium]